MEEPFKITFKHGVCLSEKVPSRTLLGIADCSTRLLRWHFSCFIKRDWGISFVVSHKQRTPCLWKNHYWISLNNTFKIHFKMSYLVTCTIWAWSCFLFSLSNQIFNLRSFDYRLLPTCKLFLIMSTVAGDSDVSRCWKWFDGYFHWWLRFLVLIGLGRFSSLVFMWTSENFSYTSNFE